MFSLTEREVSQTTNWKGFILLEERIHIVDDQFALFRCEACSPTRTVRRKERYCLPCSAQETGSESVTWPRPRGQQMGEPGRKAVCPQNLCASPHTTGLLKIDAGGSWPLSVVALLHHIGSVVRSAFHTHPVHTLKPEQRVLPDWVEFSHFWSALVTLHSWKCKAFLPQLWSTVDSVSLLL